MASPVHTSRRSELAGFGASRASAWPWLAGVAGAGLLLGPALAPGALLSLDLVLTPRIPFPEALLGLGHDLPRRVPLGAPLAWASDLVGGPAAGKMLLLTCLTVAFAGIVRLVREAPVAARVAAGALYAFGPFAATRVGAGHWAVLAGMALLPWALPALLTPGRDPRGTFLWLGAAALTGVFGGLMGGTVALTASRFERPRRSGRLLGSVVVAQVPWLVPALLIHGGGMRLAGGEHFATRAEGPLGVAGGLLAQHGFWRAASQVGGQAGAGLVLVGLGLTALAVFGTRDLPPPWRRPLATLAALGFLGAAAPALPGFDTLHAGATGWAPLAPLRDSHRVLVLFLLWLAPAAVLGATRLGRVDPYLRWSAWAFPLAAAVSLAAPGLLGVEGRLRPVEFPQGWAQARARVAKSPGTVLALPWHQYLNLGFAGGRRVLNPLPDYFGGDVLSSHDPELGGEPLQESTDSREAAVRTRVPELDSRTLADLGVRWVVLLHEADWRSYDTLRSDPGLKVELETPALDLYEVRTPGPEGP